MGIYDTVITQNYFTHNNTFFQQTNGLAMGSPSSETLMKLFLQYIESNFIVYLAEKHKLL